MAEMITVARYDTWPDAHIALGRLQAEGIPCMLADQNLVQTDWLYSIAVGGIKLMVDPAHVEQAQRVLATDYSSDLDDLE